MAEPRPFKAELSGRYTCGFGVGCGRVFVITDRFRTGSSERCIICGRRYQYTKSGDQGLKESPYALPRP